MRPTFFWTSWIRPYQIAYWLLLLLFVLSWGAALWFRWTDSLAIGWEAVLEPDSTRITLGQFVRRFIPYAFEAEVYRLAGHYTAPDLHVSSLAARGWLLAWLAGLTVLIALIPGLGRLGFFLTLGGLLVLGRALQLSLLGFAGRTDATLLVGLIVLFGGVAYYFHAFRATPLLTRIAVFGGLIALSAVAIGWGSTTPEPLLYFTQYGAWVPLVGTLYFIVLVSFALSDAILCAVTRTRQSGAVALINYLALHLLYFLVLALLYFSSRRLGGVELYYLDARYLLLLSAAVGVWTFPRRERYYGHWLPFAPAGAYAYLALGTVALSTLAYYEATANDAMLEMLDTMAVYIHAGYGLSFFLYTLINFAGLIAKGLPVYKVVYDPRHMPFSGVHAFGLLIVGSLLLRVSLFPYTLARGGYYNGVADAYRAEGNLFLAEQFYKESAQLAYRNHRAHYALATLARQQGDQRLTEFYFRRALEKHPSPQAYVGLSQHYLSLNKYFDALFALQEGQRAFPRHGAVALNLAGLYARVGLTDSTDHYLRQAERTAHSRPWALLSRLSWLGPDASEWPRRADIRGNYLAWQLTHRADTVAPVFDAGLVRDSVLDFGAFAYLYHQALLSWKTADTAQIATLAAYAAHPANAMYAEDLHFARGSLLFRSGQRAEGLDVLARVYAQSATMGSFFQLQWSQYATLLESYPLAGRLLGNLADRGYGPAFVPAALAWSEAGYLREARRAWQRAGLVADSSQLPLVRRMQYLLGTAPDSLRGLSDEERCWVVRFRRRELEPEVLERFIAPIGGLDARLMATAEVMHLYRRQGQAIRAVVRAERLLDQLPQANAGAARAFEQAYWQALWDAGQTQPLVQALRTAALDDPVPEQAGYVATGHELLAQLAQQAGDTLRADQHWAAAHRANPLAGLPVAALALRRAGRGDAEGAYADLLAAYQQNPDDPDLGWAYLQLALQLRLFEFAETAYGQMRSQWPADELALLTPRYEAARAVAQQAFAADNDF